MAQYLWKMTPIALSKNDNPCYKVYPTVTFIPEGVILGSWSFAQGLYVTKILEFEPNCMHTENNLSRMPEDWLVLVSAIYMLLIEKTTSNTFVHCHIPNITPSQPLSHPNHCHIPTIVSSQPWPHSTCCPIQTIATSQTFPHPNHCLIPTIVSSQHCLIQTIATSQPLSHPNHCLIPTIVSFHLLPHPNHCHIPNIAPSQPLSHPDHCLIPTLSHPNHCHIPFRVRPIIG
jgi:hypothetical protein